MERLTAYTIYEPDHRHAPWDVIEADYSEYAVDVREGVGRRSEMWNVQRHMAVSAVTILKFET